MSEKRLLTAPNWGTEQELLQLKRAGKSTEDVSIAHHRISYINQKVDFLNTTKIRKLINIHKTHFR